MDVIPAQPFTHTTSLSANSENIKLVVIIIAVSMFFYTIIFVSKLNNHFIPNKIMFMNMITDNYKRSITDFDKYVNKIIDDNDKIQSILGNSVVSAKTAPTPTATNPASASTTDSSKNTKSNGIFSMFSTPTPTPTTTTDSSNNVTVSSVFSSSKPEGFANINNTPAPYSPSPPTNKLSFVKDWATVQLKRFLSQFYIRRNTIYIRN